MNDKEKLVEILVDAGFERPESIFAAHYLVKCGVTTKKPEIDVSDDDFGAILNCAVRYAIGRRSYMPGLVIGIIKPLIPHLSQKTLWLMERDINAERIDGLGDPNIDAPKWIDLLDLIRQESRNRKEREKGL